MRIKALLALLGIILALFAIVGCDDDNDQITGANTRSFTVVVQDAAAGNAAVVGACAQLFNASGTLIQSVSTNENGQATFTNVPFGTGYFVVVSGSGFETVTSAPFDVSATLPGIPITVTVNQTTPPTTTTISGNVTGTTATLGTAVTVTLFQDGGTIIGAPQTLTPTAINSEAIAPFTFTDIPISTGNYTLVVHSEDGLFPDTTFGPFDVTDQPFAIDIPVVAAADIEGLGVPAPTAGTGTVVVFAPEGVTVTDLSFTVNGVTSTSLGDVAYVSDVTADGNPTAATVTLNGVTFDVEITPIADQFTIIRLSPTLVPTAAIKSKSKKHH